MNRCQMRAMKQLRELHEAYGKHDYQLAGSARYCNITEPIWMCACGEFRFEDAYGERISYTPDTAGEWVSRVYQGLNNRDKEVFKAFLKRIGWVADSRKVAQLIYGGRGKTSWNIKYGRYETRKEYNKAHDIEDDTF